MCKHRQSHVHIYVEPHLTGQTVKVKDIDADAKAILDTIASNVAGDEVPCTGIEVVGYAEGRVGMAPAVNGPLPYGTGVPTQCRRLIHIADVLVTALGDIDHCPAPGRRRAATRRRIVTNQMPR